MSFNTTFALKTHHHGVEIFLITLYRYMDKTPINFSGASQVLLEARTPSGDNIAPIPQVPITAGANWAKGVLGLLVDQAITDTIGTWQASVTIYVASEVISRTGTIEVLDRPGVTVLS